MIGINHFQARWTPANQSLRSSQIFDKIYQLAIKAIAPTVIFLIAGRNRTAAIFSGCFLLKSLSALYSKSQTLDFFFNAGLQISVPILLAKSGWKKLSAIYTCYLLGTNILGGVVKLITFPAAYTSMRPLNLFRSPTFYASENLADLFQNRSFSFSRYKVTTPDGAVLDVLHTKKNWAEERPTVLIFQGNGVNDHDTNNLHEHFDVITFTYRGAGASSESPHTARDLIIDGDSMIQFATDHLGIPENKLHLYGWSLGGGVAANALALHSELNHSKLVLDRTFSSTKKTAEKFLPLPVIKTLASLAVWIKSWNLDTLTAAKKLAPERICLITHSFDELMGKVNRFPPIDGTTKIDLQQRHPKNSHCAPLNSYPAAFAQMAAFLRG